MKQDYRAGEMDLKAALALAVKVLAKTCDATALTPDKRARVARDTGGRARVAALPRAGGGRPSRVRARTDRVSRDRARRPPRTSSTRRLTRRAAPRLPARDRH